MEEGQEKRAGRGVGRPNASVLPRPAARPAPPPLTRQVLCKGALGEARPPVERQHVCHVAQAGRQHRAGHALRHAHANQPAKNGAGLRAGVGGVASAACCTGTTLQAGRRASPVPTPTLFLAHPPHESWQVLPQHQVHAAPVERGDAVLQQDARGRGLGARMRHRHAMLPKMIAVSSPRGSS